MRFHANVENLIACHHAESLPTAPPVLTQTSRLDSYGQGVYSAPPGLQLRGDSGCAEGYAVTVRQRWMLIAGALVVVAVIVVLVVVYSGGSSGGAGGGGGGGY